MTSKEAKKTFDKLADQFTLDYQDYLDTKHSEQQAFKKQFKRDWNSNHEKVEKQMEEKQKQLNALAEEWIEIAYPDEKNIWKHEYDITVVIKKKQRGSD
jgi:hypothetical protein